MLPNTDASLNVMICTRWVDKAHAYFELTLTTKCSQCATAAIGAQTFEQK